MKWTIPGMRAVKPKNEKQRGEKEERLSSFFMPLHGQDILLSTPIMSLKIDLTDRHHHRRSHALDAPTSLPEQYSAYRTSCLSPLTVALRAYRLSLTTMNVNDIYPPLNLAQILVHDDQTILSENIPHHYLMRQIGLAWYRIMEEIFHDVPVGTRILVRRDTAFQGLVGNHVTHDYITTRVGHPTLYGHWTHQNVAYLHNELSPYPFMIDAFTERNQIMEENHNNHMIPQVNPLPEGQMEVDLPASALPAPALPDALPPIAALPPIPAPAPALQALAEAFLQSSNILFYYR